MAERKKVLIVEDNVALCDGIATYFRNKDELDVLPQVYDGAAALPKLAEADVIITDIIMPHLDGFALMERVAAMTERQPDIIVISALGMEELVHRACSLGAKYYMVKPFNMESIYRRTLDIVGMHTNRRVVGSPMMVNVATKSLDEEITNIFLLAGIPAHIKGYHYLRYGIKLVVENNGLINRITKELYPAIAENYDTSSSKVERAIRHAIDVAWSRGKIEKINEYFGFSVYSKNDKPTNGEFIALVADKMIMERSA